MYEGYNEIDESGDGYAVQEYELPDPVDHWVLEDFRDIVPLEC